MWPNPQETFDHIYWRKLKWEAVTFCTLTDIKSLIFSSNDADKLSKEWAHFPVLNAVANSTALK